MTTWDIDFGIPLGQTVSNQSFSAYAKNISIAVVLGGTSIPFSNVNYSEGFTFTPNTTSITVKNTGTYLIDYKIRTTVSLVMSSTVTRNAVKLDRLTYSPGITGSTYSGTAIISLNSNDILELQLFGLVGTAVLADGVGAVLNIIRLA